MNIILTTTITLVFAHIANTIALGIIKLAFIHIISAITKYTFHRASSAANIKSSKATIAIKIIIINAKVVKHKSIAVALVL